MWRQRSGSPRLLTTSHAGKLSIEDPNHDDFELWSPSEVRDDLCLFGRQVRLRNCPARSC